MASLMTSVASIFKEEGLVPLAALTAFRDPAGARADHALAIRYQGQEYLWLDNKASAGGNPWLNPYAAETVQYIGDLIAEVHAAGFDQVLLENVRFPSSTSAKQDYGNTNGVDRAGQLTADIAAWQARFGSFVWRSLCFTPILQCLFPISDKIPVFRLPISFRVIVIKLLHVNPDFLLLCK